MLVGVFYFQTLFVHSEISTISAECFQLDVAKVLCFECAVRWPLGKKLSQRCGGASMALLFCAARVHLEPRVCVYMCVRCDSLKVTNQTETNDSL
jgi:hypothetical protein